MVVIGAANSAGQAAVHFSGYAGKVTMLVRGDSLEKSMSRYLIEQIAGLENIEVRTNAQAIAAEGDGHLNALLHPRRRRRARGGGRRRVRVHRRRAAHGLARGRGRARRARLHPRRPGRQGRAGWPLKRDPFLLETSVPGVFVAGDVRARSMKRVASAVGEGSMSVSLVHEYLAE